jgi:hypothetical protein
MSAAGVLVDADAPPASESDNPAAPNTGTALLRRFDLEACFELAIETSPVPFEHLRNKVRDRARLALTLRAPQFHKKRMTPGRRGYGR